MHLFCGVGDAQNSLNFTVTATTIGGVGIIATDLKEDARSVIQTWYARRYNRI